MAHRVHLMIKLFVWLVVFAQIAEQSPALDVLFLGDNGMHRPRLRFADIEPTLKDRGIKLTYTDQVADLNPGNLGRYDAVLLYADIDAIEPAPAKALLEYVKGGGGFVPVHCASYCFRNSKEIVALIGAQFERHGSGVIRTEVSVKDHPVMRGFGGFESWDETYVHRLHNEKNRTVLTYRVDSAGREPWTWVRTHGNGKVFYTAWGHDDRTWRNPGFQNLIERGIRWAANDDPTKVPDYLSDQPFPIPQMIAKRTDVEPFEYVEVGREVPSYAWVESRNALGDTLTKMQKPLMPEESIKHIVVPDGFRVELFAAEPDLKGKPMCMAWDEDGRLWVAESVDYPNELHPEGKGNDRIRILEDTDGDWKADKFTVFADKLSIPTSIVFHRGGAIVQNGTQTIYLKDNDGDGIADQRTVLFSGWGVRDTHAGVSNFQYGLDNWTWAMQGLNESRPVVDGEPFEYSFRQGFFRFQPDGSELEFVRSTDNNSWGLGISEEGILFGSTANGNPSVYMPISNRYYERVNGWKASLRLNSIADTYRFQPITNQVRQGDYHGGYTAGAGHALYTAREYPIEYWNRVAFVNGPTGHLVGAFLLRRDGSDFHSTNPFNLFASNDEWTAPIMSEVGPDGQVWVIDWYNYILQHNSGIDEFDTGKGRAYETELRDKKHARIYRVVHESNNHEPATPLRLTNASPTKLIEVLSHPTMLWRKHAQRLLVERGKQDIIPQLVSLAKDEYVDEIGLNVGSIHALWTMHGLGALDGSDSEATAAAVACLRHPSPGVRRNALKVLPNSDESSTLAVINSGALSDTDAQVRLSALLALSDLPPSEPAGSAILAVMQDLSNDRDAWIRDAAICAAATNAASFLNAVTQSDINPTPTMLQSVQIVAEHFGRSFPVNQVEGLLRSLASDSRTDFAEAIVFGLAAGWPANVKPKLNQKFEKHLELVLKKISSKSQGKLVRLARDWGSKSLDEYSKRFAETLLARIDDGSNYVEVRSLAARGLIEFAPDNAEFVKALIARIHPHSPPQLCNELLKALALSESTIVGPALLEKLSSLTPQNRKVAISVLLERPDSTTSLLQAIDDRIVQLAELSLEQQQRLTMHPDSTIRERSKLLFERGGAMPNADRQQILSSYISATKIAGDLAEGKRVFTKHCAKCHRHSGEGSDLGPDLTGVAVKSKEELLRHILDPNQIVDGNYRTYAAITNSGESVSGLLVSESRTTIEIVDVEGKRKRILREDIEQLFTSGISLMPEGIEREVSLERFADLLEFLTHRGSFVPLDISASATHSSANRMFTSDARFDERLTLEEWSPKSVAGVPFRLIDPAHGRVKNIIELHSPRGKICRQLPRLVGVPCNSRARAIHLLGAVSAWGFPNTPEVSVSTIVRLKYVNGTIEEHKLKNGVHFADYIRRHDVPQSQFAFIFSGGQQVRYLAIYPKHTDEIQEIEFVKGPDKTSPLFLAITLELI